ncbi:unnamed protein product [Echinostoma caproni]|uniref:Occludin_ELL domain-containing protein n=1 Tax=Echinostoma caproni TaxID=27848 RepID=A0A183A8K7_9TREM|nr:unnamed protein product [Echinostoma caproni]
MIRPSQVNNTALSPASLHNTVYTQQSQHVHFGSGGSGGSEGESAAHTPCSYVSSGSSTHGGIPPGQVTIHTTVVDGVNRRGNRNGPSSRQLSGLLTQHVACDLDESVMTQDTGRDTNSKGRSESSCRTAASSRIEDLSPDLSSKFAELDRMFPRISEASQVKLYRMEFERTYPGYSRLYHSFSEIWGTLHVHHSELLEATQHKNVDHLVTTRLADQLNALLDQVRTQQFCEKQTELTLMAHKLRLLKRRLGEFRESQKRAKTSASEFAKTASLEDDTTLRFEGSSRELRDFSRLDANETSESSAPKNDLTVNCERTRRNSHSLV